MGFRCSYLIYSHFCHELDFSAWHPSPGAFSLSVSLSLPLKIIIGSEQLRVVEVLGWDVVLVLVARASCNAECDPSQL